MTKFAVRINGAVQSTLVHAKDAREAIIKAVNNWTPYINQIEVRELEGEEIL